MDRMLVALVIAALLVPLQACQSAPRKDATAPATASTRVTTSDLLRWPLEGESGFQKTIAALRTLLNPRQLETGEFTGNGPVRLADGYMLADGSFDPKTGPIHIDLLQQPCLKSDQAAALIGAKFDPVVEDAHGVDRGRTYNARRNGVWLTFSTTPLTYQCVRAIHIYPATVPAPEPVATLDLLRWPLEGEAGVQRTVAAVKRLFQLHELQTGELTGKGTITLADNFVLSGVTFNPKYGDMDISVRQEPCLTPAIAAATINATSSPIIDDAHGIDRGQTYTAVSSGVRVRFTTTPVTYKCVDSIYVDPN